MVLILIKYGTMLLLLTSVVLNKAKNPLRPLCHHTELSQPVAHSVIARSPATKQSHSLAFYHFEHSEESIVFPWSLLGVWTINPSLTLKNNPEVKTPLYTMELFPRNTRYPAAMWLLLI